MVRIRDLKPGALVSTPGQEKMVFVGIVESHPIWPSLQLVIWRERFGNRDWSHDCLDANMELPFDSHVSQEDCERRLRETLLDRSQW